MATSGSGLKTGISDKKDKSKINVQTKSPYCSIYAYWTGLLPTLYHLSLYHDFRRIQSLDVILSLSYLLGNIHLPSKSAK